ncbi:stimulated by retinoic acid gene 8 protein homolog isoform X1 [Lithobates pipiens]
MRGHFKAEDSGSSSLKDVKEEYMQMTFCQEQGGALANSAVTSESERMFWHLQSDFEVELEEAVEELLTDKSQTPEPLTSPDLIEFERYLHFYKHMMDMLAESHMVSPEQFAQPVVSKVVANLWQDLKREGDSSIYQYGIPQAQSTPCFFTFLSDLGCTDGGAKESSTGSQEATSSFLSSTPEEQILFEDAFDVASDFLNHGAIQTTSSPSGLHELSPWESPEGNLYLYQQIYDFLRSSLSSYTKMSAPQFDYETMFLRCTESFDDEDDL